MSQLRITKELASRVGELPTDQVRLVHGTLNYRHPAELADAEHTVLAATTTALLDRRVDMCPDCTGLTSDFTDGYVHTGWCPAARNMVRDSSKEGA